MLLVTTEDLPATSRSALQVDTDKVSQTAPFLHTSWSGLVQIFGNLGILIYYIGWPALLGFAVLLVTVPTQVRCCLHGFFP